MTAAAARDPHIIKGYYFGDRDEVEEEPDNEGHVKARQRNLREQTFDKITHLRGRDLGKAKDSRGREYTRLLEYGPGGEELMRIVAGLGKGVKKINGTQTLNGAMDWIDSHKKGQNWHAFEDDITGADGEPDGIEEVVIRWTW